MPQMTIGELTKAIHKIFYEEEDKENTKKQKYMKKNKKKEKTSINYGLELDHDENSVIEQLKG